MEIYKSGKQPFRAKPVTPRVVQAKRRARDSRVLADQCGTFSSLDVHISPTLQQRIAELGLAPITDAVEAKHMSLRRSTLFDKPLATKIIQ